MTTATAALEQTGSGLFPLTFEVDYPARSSRLLTLLRLPLLIPLAALNLVLTMILMPLTVIAWFSIVLIGRYPRPLFNLAASILKWEANYLAYQCLLTDRYPLFSTSDSRVRFEVQYSPQSSRLLAFGRIVTIWPGYFVFWAVSFVAFYLLLPLSWIAILITGHHPRRLFDFQQGTVRWDLRLVSHAYLMRDEYPPYSMRSEAPCSSNLTAFILGICMIGLLLLLFSLASGESVGAGRDDDDGDWGDDDLGRSDVDVDAETDDY